MDNNGTLNGVFNWMHPLVINRGNGKSSTDISGILAAKSMDPSRPTVQQSNVVRLTGP